jgi:PRTRC genetic system ThiF family protein
MNYPGLASQPPRSVLAYQSPTVQIVVVGAGGTGSWLVGHLARLVWDFNRKWALVHNEQPRRASLLIVDYDHVEESNIRARQNFCPAEVGYPKAQLLANRLAFAFGLSEQEISAHVGPFTSALLSRGRRWNELKIIVGCVDNAKARQTIAKCLATSSYGYEANHDSHLPLIWWIDSGNALHAGQVLCGNVATVDALRGVLHDPMCLRLPSPALIHPELLTPRPEEEMETTTPLSCKDLVLAGEPAMQQSRTINNHMAALVYGYVEKLMYGGLTTFASYTDNASFTTRSLETTPEGLSQALGLPPSFFTTVEAEPEEDDEKDLEDEEDEL